MLSHGLLLEGGLAHTIATPCLILRALQGQPAHAFLISAHTAALHDRYYLSVLNGSRWLIR